MKIKPTFFIVLCGWLLSMCYSNRLEIKTDCAQPSQPSFTNDVLPIFNAHCNTSGCHSGSFPSANFDLSPSQAYATLSKKGSGYIDTLQPRFSALVSAMRSTSNPMPPTGVLDECTIQRIEKWMSQGAKNN